MKNLSVILVGAVVAVAVGCGDSAGDTDSVYAARRQSMVQQQIVARGISDKRVLAAMEKVARHRFVAPRLSSYAYEDTPLPIKADQTISQPYIVALMTELLQLSGDEKVLEIGTGSGYQAAVLAELAKEVCTIEIVKELAGSAEQLLNELGYANVTVRCGDGFLGWPERAPFDCIIVTCAPAEVPQPLVDQLVEGGKLVIPVGEVYQKLKLLTKKDGKIMTKDIIPVRFVPMTGEGVEEQNSIPQGEN